MVFIHSKKCLNIQKEYDLRLKAFNEKYPNCCKACDGHGFVTWYERLDDHGGMDMQDICGCVADGKCPLCGEQVWGDDENIDQDLSRCNNCGWTEDTELVRPPAFDYPCECEIKEEKNYTFTDWY